MLGSFGQIMNLMSNLPKLQEEMDRLQQRLGQISAEGDAGGGLVRIKVNGRFEMVSCTLAEEAVRPADRELLEDMIKAAASLAVRKAREQVAEETAKLASSLGLPAGLKLPGLELPGA